MSKQDFILTVTAKAVRIHRATCSKIAAGGVTLDLANTADIARAGIASCCKPRGAKVYIEEAQAGTEPPVVENTPEPVVENTPEPVVENTPEPVVETTPEPVVEDAEPITMLCDWCFWRLGRSRPARWAARGDEVDRYCDEHKGHAAHGVDLISDLEEPELKPLLERAENEFRNFMLSYSGGAGSIQAMGVEGDEQKLLVDRWRAANPNLVSLWAIELEDIIGVPETPRFDQTRFLISNYKVSKHYWDAFGKQVVEEASGVYGVPFEWDKKEGAAVFPLTEPGVAARTAVWDIWDKGWSLFKSWRRTTAAYKALPSQDTHWVTSARYAWERDWLFNFALGYLGLAARPGTPAGDQGHAAGVSTAAHTPEESK